MTVINNEQRILTKGLNDWLTGILWHVQDI